MDNLRIYLNLVDGSLLPLEVGTGRDLIEHVFSDDVRPPPSVMVIEADTESGERVSIRVPFDKRRAAFISIE